MRRAHFKLYESVSVNFHMIFNIKMEDFLRKACLVMGGHVTHALDIITYSSVVLREIVSIALTTAVFHELGAKDAGESAIIVRVSYGQKSWCFIYSMSCTIHAGVAA